MCLDKWEICLAQPAWVLKNPLGPVECHKEGLNQSIQVMKHAADASCNDNLQISQIIPLDKSKYIY